MSSESSSVNMKSAAVYAGIVLGAVFVLEIAFLLTGAIGRNSPSLLKYALFAIFLAVPTVAARFYKKSAADPGGRRPQYWPLPWKGFWLILIGVPVVLLFSNAIEAALGWTSLDMSFPRVASYLPEDSQIPSGYTFLVLAIMIDFVAIAVVYAPLALCFEHGWRAHFGSQIAPLGRLKAYAITGLLTGLCFAPLVFADTVYVAHPPIAALRIILLVAILGGISSEILRISGNVTLCAVFAAVFFSQLVGTISHIFPLRRLDLAGPLGWLSIGVWALVLIAVSRIPASKKSV